MRTKNRSRLAVIITAALLIIAAAVVLMVLALKPRQVDPHEGQVYINDGFGMVWMTPLEGVDVSTLTLSDFRYVGNLPCYNGSEYDTLRGIDVSEHQHQIDWAQVATADVDFAFIRLGYRGYTEGGLFEDPYFAANMKGALENGIDVGVYFFSQAVSVQEAIEEARYVLERIKDYDVAMPVVFDWEKIDGGGARTDALESSVLTDCAVAFCEVVKNAGYEPCVYFNRHLGYYGFDLSQLTDYMFWLAVPGDFPDFYYATDIWQHTFSATIPGIETETDMNLMFIPRQEQETDTNESGK